MKKSLALWLALFLAATMRAHADPHFFVSQYENVLGTSMEIKVAVDSKAASEAAERAVLGEIARLSGILSAYDPGSEFSKWYRTDNIAVPVSAELYEVLTLFDQWRTRTGGALDASAEAVTRVWKKAAKEARLPTAAELATTVALVKQSHWRLDAATHTAVHLDRVPLMLNSFAKSYIIEHAVAAGRKASGGAAIVLNIGGDLVVSGAVSEPVVISNPKADAENDAPIDRLVVSNRAVATSGNYRRGEQIGGRWYSHIVDPRTGLPADGILSATVVAPSATDAGALATTFNVLAVEECVRLAERYKGVEYLIITRDGRRIQSPGWRGIEAVTGKQTTVSTDPQPGAEASSADDFELLVNFEINLQTQGNVKRPYIAIWIEDPDHASIRTITVWHGSDRYMPELRSWWLKNRSSYAGDPNFNASITSATRSAGKYSVKWDGKDDKGNAVKPGKYTLKLEVSREHGTYQLMRQEFDWNGQPQTLTLPGNVEISSASLDLRKKANGN